MAARDLSSLIRRYYTPVEPPLTKDSEARPLVARRARKWAIREKDLRELLAIATLEAVTRANEKTAALWPEGSAHPVVTVLAPNASAWLAIEKAKAEAEAERLANVVPEYDELESYADTNPPKEVSE